MRAAVSAMSSKCKPVVGSIEQQELAFLGLALAGARFGEMSCELQPLRFATESVGTG